MPHVVFVAVTLQYFFLKTHDESLGYGVRVTAPGRVLLCE